MRNAGLFVLNTMNENFGMTVAESLAGGVPVISSKGAPWSGLESHGCGWWIDHGQDPLVAALKAAMSLPSAKRAQMGAAGLAWVRRDFGWEGIAQRMASIYCWLLGREGRPADVFD